MSKDPSEISDLRSLNQPRLTVFDEEGRLEERSHLLGKIAEYSVVCVFVLTLVVYEWAHWYFHWKPQPVLFGVVGLCLVGYAAVRISFIIPKLRALKAERHAAHSVRTELRSLAGRGWYVFDSVVEPDGRFLGTVVVGAPGVFSVTTRFISRRGAAFENVEQPDQKTILAGGRTALADPLGQARRSAQALYALLARENLDTVTVMPVLVFPGWKVGSLPREEERDVLVGNEDIFLECLANMPSLLEARQVIQVCSLLEKLSRPRSRQPA